jgi:hypothetical protein
VLKLLLLKSTKSLTRGHELTKSRRKVWPLCLHFWICLCSEPFTLRPLWNPGRTALPDNIFIRRDGGNCPQGKQEQSLLRSDHLAGSSDSHILTRLLPSSDGSNDNFSRALPKLELMINLPYFDHYSLITLALCF